MKKKLTVALAAAALAVVPMTAASADNHTDAEVVVVHGVPGVEVNVWVNGEPGPDALLGFEFGEIETLNLPADTYSIAVAPADGDLEDAVIGPVDVTVEAGVSYSIVAHLDAAGDITATIEGNTTDEGAGIQVFHTAAFGAVDILAGGEAALEGVENGQTAFIATGAGTVPDVGVAAAGETEAALPLGDIDVPADTSILAYAVGTPDDESLQVITTTISVAAEEADDDDDADEGDEVEQPEAVHSGTGGLVSTGLPAWVAGLMVLGAVALAAPAVATARRRS
jgi:hypothetical protein